MSGFAFGLGIVAVLFVFLVSQAVKIIPEYERGVVFRLGKLVAKDYGAWWVEPMAA